MDRFGRQIIIPELGIAGQQKLRDSKVLVVGAGGLGCPAIMYLAAAGIGTIGIADGDRVEASNLNRQVIYGEKDTGKHKAVCCGEYFAGKYSDLKTIIFPEFLHEENIHRLIAPFDLILDGTDSPAFRYLLNDATSESGKPWIFASIQGNQGQMAVFHAPAQVNYRDVFPDAPAEGEIPVCNNTGVLGVLPGIIGTMQAAEAIKLIAGYPNPMLNRLLIYNMQDHAIFQTEIVPRSKKHQEA